MDLMKRISLVKARLEELHKDVEKLRSECETSKKYVATVMKNVSDSGENFKAKFEVMREHLAIELEFMRARIKMIHEISPATAEKLNKFVNIHERKNRGILRVFQAQFDGVNDPLAKEMITKLFSDSIILDDVGISSFIDLCLFSIRDTLDRLQSMGNKS